MKDKEVLKIIRAEEKRQKEQKLLIPSENIVSEDVREAVGSVLMNKYAEGYPGKRYYSGQKNTDAIEELAWKRSLALFGLSSKKWMVNVQPHSGSPANLAVYAALVPLGGKIMGMTLSHGGHLTHGNTPSFTGKFWKQVPYGVAKDTELLDYEELKEIALREKPALIVAGFTAYSRIIDFKKFRETADVVGAKLLVDMSHFAGLVAGGAYPSPFPYADVVMTTTHKTLRGPRGALIFAKKEFERDINKAVFPGLQGGPHMHTIAGIAVALKEAKSPLFKKYAKQVVKNAQTLARELTKLGWRVVSGGTDSHLVLVDVWLNGAPSTALRAGGIGGQEAEDRLEKAGISANKNTIPFDTRKPMDPSGIRLGTPVETTKGAGKKEMIAIARKIDAALRT